MPLSGLPPISPLGLGTPEVESLSSYAQRLAAAQGVLPGQLVFRVLTWLDQGRPEMVGRWSRRPRRVRIGHNNNSFTHALVWLRLLQRLTGRADLDHLTTVSWDRNFPTRTFQRDHLAWCPFCLGSDAEPYHRLLWLLQPARACFRHEVSLRSRCPRCARRIPVIHDRSMVLMCPYCRGHLLLASNEEANGRPTEYDLWTARELGEILTASSVWHRPLAWNPATALKSLGKSVGLNNAAAFARFIGTSKITCWYWFTGAARPSLPMALHTYHRVGSSLASALTGRKSLQAPTIVQQPEIHLRRPRRPRKRDWAKIKQRLQVELNQPPKKSAPLAALARRHGADPRTLRNHFPKLCLQLAKRHKKRLSEEAQHRQSLLQARIKGAMLRLMKRGEDVSPRLVAMELTHPGLFSRPNARRAYRQIFTKGK